jgi:uncharacterized tellurite resistance protein B-like protein
MLKKIKTFLQNGGYLNQTGGKTTALPHSHEEQALAAATLLVEAACLDGDYSDEEAETINQLIRDRFSLGKAEAESLLSLALEFQDQAVELHKFTNQVKQNFSHDERIHLIEMLWEVAYADGVLHDYEANLLRRIGGLIHVSDRERGDARRRVLERLGIDSN